MEMWKARGTNSVALFNLVFLQIIIFMMVRQGETLKCFVCNSKSDPRCADPIQTDWQGSDESESEDSDDNSESLAPVECHLATQYSAGIQAVSDLLRGFGHPRLGIPDLWISTSSALQSNSGSGGYSGSSGGSYGNRGYGGRGGNRGGSTWGSYGGQREQEESMGCHKVVYTESSGDSVVDRGCAPVRVANMDPCTALDSATSSNDNGNSGNSGSSGSSSSFGSGHGGGSGSGSGNGAGGTFDLTQISADFCEVCNEGDGCNRAANITNINLILISVAFLILNIYVYAL